MIPTPQFTASITFHFRGHGAKHRHWFMFDDCLHRRVPMQMDGVEGLNTMGMWTDAAGTFKAGDSIKVRCMVIAPHIFDNVVQPGVKLELWDGGFFATGTVLERIEEGWPK